MQGLISYLLWDMLFSLSLITLALLSAGDGCLRLGRNSARVYVVLSGSTVPKVPRRPFTFFSGAGGQMQRTTINHSPRLLRYCVCGKMQPSIKRGTMVPRKLFKILLDAVTLLLERLSSDAFLRKLCRRIWFEGLLPYSHQHFIVLSERILLPCFLHRSPT
jgi:hypothetical protein